MGGGGAMRAAAKVAGIGVANSGFRGFTPDHPVCAAARTALRPVSVSAVSSTSDDVRGRVLSASENPAVDGASVQRPCLEFDDWEFPDGKEKPLPRLVFGGAPTLQEAKEATSDLKEAIENVFLSPANHFGSSQATGADLLSNSHDLKTKSCVNTETTVITPSAPRHAFQAFRLLRQSAATQNVVASIACDAKVWNAVLENPELQKFLQSHSSACDNMDVEESVADNGSSCQASPRSKDRLQSQSRFADFFQNMKAVVIDMMSSFCDFFQNVLGGYSVVPNADGSPKISVDKALMGLAVMVIMVVVLKRAY